MGKRIKGIQTYHIAVLLPRLRNTKKTKCFKHLVLHYPTRHNMLTRRRVQVDILMYTVHEMIS